MGRKPRPCALTATTRTPPAHVLSTHVLAPTEVICGLQLQREVPITLVLGVATSASALSQLLPVAACDCLRMRAFPLMPVSWRL